MATAKQIAARKLFVARVKAGEFARGKKKPAAKRTRATKTVARKVAAKKTIAKNPTYRKARGRNPAPRKSVTHQAPRDVVVYQIQCSSDKKSWVVLENHLTKVKAIAAARIIADEYTHQQDYIRVETLKVKA